MIIIILLFNKYLTNEDGFKSFSAFDHDIILT